MSKRKVAAIAGGAVGVALALFYLLGGAFPQ